METKTFLTMKEWSWKETPRGHQISPMNWSSEIKLGQSAVCIFLRVHRKHGSLRHRHTRVPFSSFACLCALFQALLATGGSLCVKKQWAYPEVFFFRCFWSVPGRNMQNVFEHTPGETCKPDWRWQGVFFWLAVGTSTLTVTTEVCDLSLPCGDASVRGCGHVGNDWPVGIKHGGDSVDGRVIVVANFSNLANPSFLAGP